MGGSRADGTVFVLPSTSVVDYVYTTSLESIHIVQSEEREKRASWDDNNAPSKGNAVSNVVPSKVEGKICSLTNPHAKTALCIFTCSTCPFDSEMTSGLISHQ